MNMRLGIVGGISILGTSGIVRPLSSEAWTATITASMSVARAMGRIEVVLSAGRASEAAHMARYALPEETYVMMGDYVEYALLEAARHGFDKVHLIAQWAKMLKIAMATPQTHVSHGVIDLAKAAAFLGDLGFPGLKGREFKTAREMFDLIAATPGGACGPLFRASAPRQSTSPNRLPAGSRYRPASFLTKGRSSRSMAKLTIIGIGGGRSTRGPGGPPCPPGS